ncbi:MAG: hypothetical protein GWP91_11440 [Rhodobacterales bacterium]|nr:hypothetical protein [Rhodobacterales bacterium]
MRSNSTLVAWVGGRALRERELENLLDYLFADRSDPETRHLVQMAVGVNALLQREPTTLRIETGDGLSALRIELDKDGNAKLGESDTAINGTYLYVEFTQGWLSRFRPHQDLHSQQLVEERCMYTPVPILLNGSAPFGYRGCRHIEVFGAQHQTHFDEGGRRGVIAVHRQPGVVGYNMVVGGVVICKRPLELLGDKLVGVICDDGLRKTADHSDIVEDAAFVTMLHALQPHATNLVRTAGNSSYRPAKLPAVPRIKVAKEIVSQRPARAPLPHPIPTVGLRIPLTVAQLRSGLSVTVGMPIFRVDPQDVSELQSAVDAHRFPWPVLILTEGQTVSLEDRLQEGTAIHRLASVSDVDFVRRVVQPDSVLRQHRFSVGPWQITLSLHQGLRPPWGNGQPGLPWCSSNEETTRAAGVIAERWVEFTTHPRGAESTQLQRPIHLPGVSMAMVGEGLGPDDQVMSAVLREAWSLIGETQTSEERRLLAALMGQSTTPALRGNPDIALAATLPLSVPRAMVQIPIAHCVQGPLTLASFLALQGTPNVQYLTEDDDLLAFKALEERYGFGHLIHPSVAYTPIWGLGFTGQRWAWLSEPSAWNAQRHVLLVAAHLGEYTGDPLWNVIEQPAPGLVFVSRWGESIDDPQGALLLLYQELLKCHLQDDWSRSASPGPVCLRRARAMGRLALFHLVRLLNIVDDRILMPTDGGARRSIQEIQDHPKARVVARMGVSLTEPWTFELTRDELAALGEDTLALRYDDDPTVWRSLVESVDGWLIRQHVQEGGVQGWLGLRHPYDATTGILVQASGRLLALPEMDHQIPCHGLLWPDGQISAPNTAQRRLLHLAGLRLYQALIDQLQEETDASRLFTAHQYAMAFVLRASVQDRQNATASALAALVPVTHGDGNRWGSLEQWLQAPESDRPPLPVDVNLLLAASASPQPIVPIQVDDVAHNVLLERLNAAVAQPNVGLRFAKGAPDQPGIAEVHRVHSTYRAITLALNHKHTIVQAAFDGPGTARELLLLEMARKVCNWLKDSDNQIAFNTVQQSLVAQQLIQS